MKLKFAIYRKKTNKRNLFSMYAYAVLKCRFSTGEYINTFQFHPLELQRRIQIIACNFDIN